MNRTFRHAALLALAVSVAATPAFAQKKDKAESSTFATVNGKAIPKIRADALIGQAAQGQPDSPDLRKAVMEELVRREVLTQESIKKGLDKEPEIQGQIELARQNVLIGAYLKLVGRDVLTQEALKKGLDKKPEVQGQVQLAREQVLIGAYFNDYVRSHPITEDQIKVEYEAIKARLGNKEYKVRHVLLENEDEAKAIIEKLKKGERIEDLAKDSKDPASMKRGGDLGWANLTGFGPISNAITRLEKGKFTETPVRSHLGWHVIQLEDTREFEMPSVEQLKDRLSQDLTQRMQQQHIVELRAKAKVE